LSALTPDQFDEFFHALYGYAPFPWQSRLARQVSSAQKGDPCWPEALALPTAAGKTACIDMAVFALACQAELIPSARTAPRRVFFVVDRRVIVDEAFDRAQNLVSKLQRAQDGILRAVADQLRSLSGEKWPLASFQLRGGMYRDDTWVRSPLQPTVITTTVDQFGSRLLFRGYGPSHFMWPVHAGLAANDSPVVLDEAHCANPFRQTIEWVQRYRQWTGQTESVPSAPFHLTLVSATPQPGIKDSFTIEDEDRNHKILGPRIRAAKPAKLVPVGNSTDNDTLERLAERLADEAVKLRLDERQVIEAIPKFVI
jgi:CRISPR-associated endonuclease/helicase Cas3